MPASAVPALTPGIYKVLRKSKNQRLHLDSELKEGEKLREELRQG